MVNSYQKGVPIKLSANFVSMEFDCNCERPECLVTLIDQDLIIKLQYIRNMYDVVRINRGYSCVEHNKAVGGVVNSQHILGKAADIVVENWPIGTIQSRLIAEQRNLGLTIGRYDEFTHVDVRYEPIVFDKRVIDK